MDCGGPFRGGEGRQSNQARMLEVADGKLCVHLRGTVEYKKIFEHNHVTPLGYMWHPAVEAPNGSRRSTPKTRKLHRPAGIS